MKKLMIFITHFQKGHKMEINDIHDPVSKMRTPGNDAPDLRMSVYIYMYVHMGQFPRKWAFAIYI